MREEPSPPAPFQAPIQSPLYHAEHADRYERQKLISEYEARHDCRLIVMIDAIFPYGVTLFEELVHDADPNVDLHLLLASPGGDGETAVRIVRSAQARCKELTVIVPDRAKSAATLVTLGAHHILMGPTSDLGPVDPQFEFPKGSLASAKDIIAAVEDAAKKVQEAPESYPLYAALLSDLTALMVQQARSAIDRTADLLEEALRSNPDRSDEEVAELKKRLETPLIELPKSHAAIFGHADALNAGLPVQVAAASSDQWQMVWRLWAKYFAMGARFYENSKVSKEMPWQSE